MITPEQESRLTALDERMRHLIGARDAENRRKMLSGEISPSELNRITRGDNREMSAIIRELKALAREIPADELKAWGHAREQRFRDRELNRG